MSCAPQAPSPPSRMILPQSCSRGQNWRSALGRRCSVIQHAGSKIRQAIRSRRKLNTMADTARRRDAGWSRWLPCEGEYLQCHSQTCGVALVGEV